MLYIEKPRSCHTARLFLFMTSECVHKIAKHLECLSRRLALEAAVVGKGFYRHKRQSARDNARRGALYIALSLFAHVEIQLLFESLR